MNPRPDKSLGPTDVQVLEGSFVEAPAADGSGMVRTAFGEFIGPEGELASYAFGWTTGADPHVAHLTIGIGGGNPGGGSFHAVVFEHEDGHAFGLVDEPFEAVPQGGPDLTADAARRHHDLPFVWWVADQMLQRDRRAWWMRHWVLRTGARRTRTRPAARPRRARGAARRSGRSRGRCGGSRRPR